MKAYIKRVLDAHRYYCLTKRQSRNKIPKKSGDRKGTKTAERMKAKRDINRET